MFHPHNLSTPSQSLDLERLTALLVRSSDLTHEDAKLAAYLYAGFMRLQRLFPNDELTPSVAVELVWHLHMETPNYEIDCRNIIGFVPARRALDMPHAHERGWKRAKELYRGVCGIDLAGLALGCAREPAAARD